MVRFRVRVILFLHTLMITDCVSTYPRIHFLHTLMITDSVTTYPRIHFNIYVYLNSDVL